MEKSVLVLVIIGGIFLFLGILIFVLPYFSEILWSFNNQEPQTPDISCNVDLDCMLWVYPEWSKCEVCFSCESFDLNDTRVIAINKEWRPHCPFPKPIGVACVQCISTINNYKITDINRTKCIENKCQKILD